MQCVPAIIAKSVQQTTIGSANILLRRHFIFSEIYKQQDIDRKIELHLKQVGVPQKTSAQQILEQKIDHNPHKLLFQPTTTSLLFEFATVHPLTPNKSMVVDIILINGLHEPEIVTRKKMMKLTVNSYLKFELQSLQTTKRLP